MFIPHIIEYNKEYINETSNIRDEEIKVLFFDPEEKDEEVFNRLKYELDEMDAIQFNKNYDLILFILNYSFDTVLLFKSIYYRTPNIEISNYLHYFEDDNPYKSLLKMIGKSHDSHIIIDVIYNYMVLIDFLKKITFKPIQTFGDDDKSTLMIRELLNDNGKIFLRNSILLFSTKLENYITTGYSDQIKKILLEIIFRGIFELSSIKILSCENLYEETIKSLVIIINTYAKIKITEQQDDYLRREIWKNKGNISLYGFIINTFDKI